jgi:hypothetical protein
MEQSLDVVQVTDLLNAKDDEVVPMASMLVSHVPSEPTEQVHL